MTSVLFDAARESSTMLWIPFAIAVVMAVAYGILLLRGPFENRSERV